MWKMSMWVLCCQCLIGHSRVKHSAKGSTKNLEFINVKKISFGDAAMCLAKNRTHFIKLLSVCVLTRAGLTVLRFETELQLHFALGHVGVWTDMLRSSIANFVDGIASCISWMLTYVEHKQTDSRLVYNKFGSPQGEVQSLLHYRINTKLSYVLLFVV